MNARGLTIAAVALTAMLAGAPAANADALNFGAVKDNTLYEKNSGDISNGAGSYFFAGNTQQGSDDDTRRGVIAFDVSSIPAGSTITDVDLTLNMSRTQAGTRTVALHRLNADWGEGNSNAGGQEGGGDSAADGDATWLYRFYDSNDPEGSPAWSGNGGNGDYTPAASASISVGGENDYTWSTAGMVADVQAWVDNGGTNFGWIVICQESSSTSAKRFDSRQNNDVSNRPLLVVTFNPPAPTGACCFDDGHCEPQTQADCLALGETYIGDDVPCTPNPCTQPVGACCYADGSCMTQTQTDCQTAGGTYQGNGTSCVPNPCPQPSAACCFTTGACSIETEAACNSMGGTWGFGASCIPNPCPQPTGACCADDGTCSVETPGNCAAAGGNYQGDDTVCTFNLCPVVLTPFLDPLPIPVPAIPDSGVPGGEATYSIAMEEVDQQLHSQLPATRVWGYAGAYPGPTIEATVGEPVTVNWINDLENLDTGMPRTEHYLPVDHCPHGAATSLPRTVVHLHGGHVPAQFDGYPEDTFLPGQSATYWYPNMQPPATLWFHDHALGITRLNVYMGLAAFYLLRDQDEIDLGLPAGDYEIPLAIQDRSFNGDGSLRYPADWQDHFFGNKIVVNGKVWPYLEVDQGKYRFRMLDGCSSRTLTLSLSTGDSFQQIGTDGGLLPAPVTLTEVTISPGERADIVMDFAGYAPGTEIFLVNSAPAPYPGDPGVGVVPQVMKFIVTGDTGHTDPVPAALTPVEVIPEGEAILSRDLILRRATDPCTGQVWLINGLAWDDITEEPNLGDTEIWRWINRSGNVHPMHMHLVLFQVLDRQDFEVVLGEIVPIGAPIPPEPNEMGWKDTVRADPNQITRVIARFEDFDGLFSYHCHILEHEDHEMMRQFRAVDTCPEDLNGNGAVDFADILVIIGAWGSCPLYCPNDLNNNGSVDFADILEVIGAWGSCPST
ncbi:MAG: DNRLRE domain-containing protein [Planctomycetes bacterium]|nr:DNRLRE domain-containing protein [Planctomycetota bacterium]